MTYSLTLTEKDFLTHQLYESSTNPLRSLKRKRDYIIIIVFGLIFTLATYLNGDDKLFYTATLFIILWILCGKIYLRWRYKKHYSKHIRITYKGFFNQEFQIEITDDYIITVDKTGESKIKISEIKQISDIPDYFLIGLSTGPTLIIPKRLPQLNEEIVNMAKRSNVLFLNEMHWEWR